GISVNKTVLATLVDLLSTREEEDYTLETWTVFIEALESAEDILADEEVTQKIVDEAVIHLLDALERLEKVKLEPEEVDKTTLAKLVEQANALNNSDYTPESWKILSEVLATAKAVLADEEATQGEIVTA